MTQPIEQAAPPGGASEEAIRHHYDSGNAFFASWLDESMTYSAARYSTGRDTAETLNAAQLRKLDWHLSAARVGSGCRLLDVGCGWGGLMHRAVETRGAAEVVGLTPSREQASWVNERFADLPIKANGTTWQEAQLTQPFDSIISIGAIEHFARPEMSTEQKQSCYEEFFRFCEKNIAGDGWVSIQFIAWMDTAQRDEIANLPLELFPESNLPRLMEILQSAEPRFHVMMLENRPQDYSRTLQEWLRRINERREDLILEFGKDLVKRHIRGFRRFILGFENETLGLYRIALKRKRVGR